LAEDKHSRLRRPLSVLVVVHTDDGQALLLHRPEPFNFWQSVTGSLQDDETHSEAAVRELREETGLTNEGRLEYAGISRTFVIDPRWRDRFAPGVVENLEFEWRYRLPAAVDISLCPAEHSDYIWLPLEEAADKVWSWTNRDALLALADEHN
jgi:dATP pyrophosphohydrolase